MRILTGADVEAVASRVRAIVSDLPGVQEVRASAWGEDTMEVMVSLAGGKYAAVSLREPQLLDKAGKLLRHTQEPNQEPVVRAAMRAVMCWEAVGTFVSMASQDWPAGPVPA